MQVQRVQSNYNANFCARLKWDERIGGIVSPEIMQKYSELADKIGSDKDLISVKLKKHLYSHGKVYGESYELKGEVIKPFSCMEDNKYIEHLKKVNHVKDIEQDSLINQFLGVSVLCDDKKALQSRITKHLTDGLKKVSEKYNELAKYDNKDFFEYLNLFIK